MAKMTRLGLMVAAVLALAVGVDSQDPPKAKADWRKVGLSTEFLAHRLVGETTDHYEFTALDLISEWGRRGEVTVRYDARQVASVPKLSLRGVKEPNKLSAFDLCQRALENNGLTLFPEAGTPRAFVVDAGYNAGERAPLVKEEELASMATSEWAALLYTLKSAGAAHVVSMAQSVMSQSGGRIQSTPGQPTLLVVDRAANVMRVLEVFRQVDLPREDPKTVPYQRATKAHQFQLAKTLQAFLDRYAAEINVAAGKFYVSYEHETRMLVGMVPQAVCSFLDAAIDAADKNVQAKRDEDELQGPNFACFEVPIPPEQKAAAIEASLRQLFEPEQVAGDMRTMIKGDQTKSLVVRCRKWLEAGVRDALETLMK
ncbi:MAG: hypothetical protein IT461_10040 [Planctomycetes bacterium]|jgi:hypothetical protein|nr:hypothetical protein [Planctomycetota bacterium]